MSRGQFLPACEHLSIKTGKPLADLSRLPPAHEATRSPSRLFPPRNQTEAALAELGLGMREESRVLTTPTQAGDGF